MRWRRRRRAEASSLRFRFFFLLLFVPNLSPSVCPHAAGERESIPCLPSRARTCGPAAKRLSSCIFFPRSRFFPVGGPLSPAPLLCTTITTQPTTTDTRPPYYYDVARVKTAISERHLRSFLSRRQPNESERSAEGKEKRQETLLISGRTYTLGVNKKGGSRLCVRVCTRARKLCLYRCGVGGRCFVFSLFMAGGECARGRPRFRKRKGSLKMVLSGLSEVAFRGCVVWI